MANGREGLAQEARQRRVHLLAEAYGAETEPEAEHEALSTVFAYEEVLFHKYGKKVSHKTSIDSLFLDEGFGTLDPETLEIVMDALDSLNASGKMIGVISHVEALKERIPLQLKVQKTGMGLSALEVRFRFHCS